MAEKHGNAVFNGRDPLGEKKDKRHAPKVNPDRYRRLSLRDFERTAVLKLGR